MTTKTKNKFFWSNFQKNFSYKDTRILFLIVSCIVLLTACQRKQELQLESMHTANGWGYMIKLNDKTIIKQSIIPVIQQEKSFETEEEALKVGHLVLEKLKANNSPTITKKDLILLSIKT